jgi:hypothetical protein
MLLIDMKNIDKCPFCGGELFVREYGCRECGTEVRGEFGRGRLSALPSELLEFVEVFLLNEGNIKAVEETLGCSYPKVKGMLRRVIKALGYECKDKDGEKRQDILDMLDSGEITAEEARGLLDKV